MAVQACVGDVEPEVTQDGICGKLDWVSSGFVGVIFFFLNGSLFV